MVRMESVGYFCLNWCQSPDIHRSLPLDKLGILFSLSDVPQFCSSRILTSKWPKWLETDEEDLTGNCTAGWLIITVQIRPAATRGRCWRTRCWTISVAALLSVECWVLDEHGDNLTTRSPSFPSSGFTGSHFLSCWCGSRSLILPVLHWCQNKNNMGKNK